MLDRAGLLGWREMVPVTHKLQGQAVGGPGTQPYDVAAQLPHPDRDGGVRGGLVPLAQESLLSEHAGHSDLAAQPAEPGDRLPVTQRVNTLPDPPRRGPHLKRADHWPHTLSLSAGTASR